MGRKHVAKIRTSRCAVVDCVVDPADAARDYAASQGVPIFFDLESLFAHHRPDGVIIANPNRLHVSSTLACLDFGVPVLVEKPVSDSVASASGLLEAIERSGVPVLVGHHRRHHRAAREAKRILEAGVLGRVLLAQCSTWIYKGDDYFEIPWHSEPGAGPVLINLVHDVDLLRFLCGEIVFVEALASNIARGLAVEDSAVALIEFASGALGTLSVSDAIPSPWSWELSAAENPIYPSAGQSYLHIGAAQGALALPNLAIWRYRDKKSWWEPLLSEQEFAPPDDPLMRQLEHFCDVIADNVPPAVSVADALETLKVVEAIHFSATMRGSR